MNITSVFSNGKEIPSKYTCDGENTVTAVEITETPHNAKSLALIMDDPDIPEFVKQKFGITVYDHWILFNIPPTTRKIDGTAGVHGKNSSGKNEYTGPCPPDKRHRYFFRAYALDRMLPLREGTTKEEIILAMKGHILAEAELMGTYERVR